MLDAITAIEKHTSLGKDAFMEDELVQTWCVHHLMILGEAASRIDTAVKESNADVPWSQITAMRNLLVHAYFSVDAHEVWAVVENDLPQLRARLEEMLQRFE